MAKKSIQELKEYFQAGKRPTESQFGDLLDSYEHLDKFKHYKEIELVFEFPDQQPDMAIDVLLGNTYINGIFDIKITGGAAVGITVGVINKRVIIGANHDNWLWFNPIEKIIDCEGPILNHIFIGNIEWDNNISQYKFTIYHKQSGKNPYIVKISQLTITDAILESVVLSDIYHKPLGGQNTHYVNFNDNVGIGIKTPTQKLTVSGEYLDANNGFPIDGLQSTAILRLQYNSTGNGEVLDFGMNRQPNYGWIQAQDFNAPVYYNLLLNPKGGKVGIGTEDPKNQFHVQFNEGEPKSIQFATFPNTANSMNCSLRYTWYNSYCDIGIVRGGSSDIEAFCIKFNDLETVRFASTGNVALQGKLEAKDVVITPTPTADFVFAPNYRLSDIADLEQFVLKNKHLPDIPSANEMTEKGLEVGQFQIKLLQKIEELTLYIISQNKEIEKLKAQINN